MKKLKWVLYVTIILALLLSGCSNEKKTQTLKIGVISDVGAIPFVIAEQQGFYKKRGLNIDIQVFKSAMDRDTALQTGNLDGAMADMLTIIFFNDAGFDVKMTSQTKGNYRLITSPKLNADSFMKLKSPTIGLSSNTVIDFATQKVAEAQGFDQKMSKVAIPQMPVRLEMLGAGELNGATLPEPLASSAILDGGSVIGSTEDFNLYPGIFMMTQTILNQNPKSVKLLYEAYNEAVTYINQANTQNYFNFLVERLGFPINLEGHFLMPKFSPAMPPDMKTFKETSAWMKKTELTKSNYSYERLTNTSVLPIAANAAALQDAPLPNSTISSISVVMDDNYPPFTFRDSSGKLQGLLVDEWKLWEKRTGVKVNLVAEDWNKALTDMKERKFDVIDTVFKNPERAAYLDFTPPYTGISVPIFFRNTISGITEAKSLTGFIVAVKKGDAAIAYLRGQGISSLVEYDSYEKLIIAAKAGEVVAFVADEPAILYLLNKYNIYKEFNYTEPLYTGQFHRGVAKGNAEMRRLVEYGFAQISPGEYRAMEQRWYGKTSAEADALLRILAIIGAIILFFSLALFICNRSLSRIVRLKTSEITAAVKAAEQSNKKLKGIITSIPDLVFLLNAKGEIQDCISNEALEKLHLHPDRFTGISVNEVLPPDIALASLEKIRLLIAENTMQELDYVFDHDGILEFYEARYVLIDEDVILCIVRNISEEKNAQERLYEMSIHDSVTGLYNRTFFEKEIASLTADKAIGAGIIMCDIDGLKLVNDTMGHQSGDQYLSTVGTILTSSFKDRALVTRIGGDEFAIIIKDTSNDEIMQYIEKIRLSIAELNTGDMAMPISISIGYGLATQYRPKLQDTLIEADDHMYRDKLHHRQSVRSYSIDLLSRMLSERDFITEGHGDRMQQNMAKMAAALHFNGEAINDILLFAQFHDIGKIGISDAILFKNGSLSDAEWIEMKRHSEIGFRIAESSPDLRHISEWIFKHHEWWNGLGYPFGLEGANIPIECRILSIVDAFDAMTNDRPYGKARSDEEAFAELEKFSGSQFDPELVAVFINLFQEGRL